MMGSREIVEGSEVLAGAELLEGIFRGLVERYGVAEVAFPREVLAAAMTRGDRYTGLQIAYMRYKKGAVLEIGGKRFLVCRGERNLAYPDSLTSGDLLMREFEGGLGDNEKLIREAALLVSDQSEYRSSVVLVRGGRPEWGQYQGESLRDGLAGESDGGIRFENVSAIVDALAGRIGEQKKETPVGRRLE